MSDDLRKYLAIAAWFVYYHHERLHDDITFDQDYWDKMLKMRGTDRNVNLEYWKNMKEALQIAINTDHYFLDTFNSPNLEIYSEEDLKLFFRKLHTYIGRNLRIEEKQEGK